MAEDPKITPDPAPQAPFQVSTLPDPPPREPVDVPTYPDPAPRGTFPVEVSPDGPPAAVRDVPTYPDPPPWSPRDVSVSVDPAPMTPIDVPNSPDDPPREPVDVNINPDGPPRVPTDVNVAPDAAPPAPLDVAVTVDSPPADPSDVPTLPDRDPSAPFDVPITLSPLPGEVPQLSLGHNASFGDLVRIIEGFDRRVGAFLTGLSKLDILDVSITAAGALDPTVLVAWYRNYVNSVGVSGLAKFISEQQALYAMNSEVAKVFDVSYFVKMTVPGSMGHIHTTLDTTAGVTGESVALAKDKLKQAEVSASPTTDGSEQNVYDQAHRFTDGQEFSVDLMVDSAIDGNLATPGGRYLKIDGSEVQPVARFSAGDYFNDGPGGRSRIRENVRNAARFGGDNVLSSPLARSSFIDGVIKNRIPGEQSDGTTLSTTQDPSTIVDDDDARVPLSFTDLRKDPRRNGYRSVYFRPMNLTVTKAIAPEYNESAAFGRTERNVSYVQTNTSLSVSFDVHAFAPEDLQVIYNKLVTLESMCYPTYGEDSLMRSGPVVRMRIGDLVGTNQGGLGGVIKSLNEDFTEALWELKKGMKVPRSFKVSLDFMVLHDGPVGILNGQFGVLSLPPGVKADKDTNLAGASDSRDGSPDTATVNPGMYMRFGEPRGR